MTSLCRMSIVRLLPYVKKAIRRFPSAQSSVYLKEISQIQVCCYCKKYGLHDDEEEFEVSGEYNRRGAYIEKPRNSAWKGRAFSQSNEIYDDDDDNDDMVDHSFRSPRRRNSGGYQQASRRGGLWEDDDGDDVLFGETNFSHSRNYNRQGGMPSRQQGFRNDALRHGMFKGPPRRGQYASDFFEGGRSMPKTNTNPEDLPIIQKNLYNEHPDVSARSMDEVEEYRKSMNMIVRGSNIPKPITQFSELNVSEPLCQVIKEQRYAAPTPIQAQGWPLALSGRDMIGISQTGSGKTLVFILPAMLHVLNQNPGNTRCSPQALVLAPTRELAQQIHHVSSKFHHSCGIKSSCIYGGAAKFPQLSKMEGSRVCVATPGRLIDFLMEGSVSLQSCSYLVLDEADRMLDMGFEPQIRQIVSQIRRDRQTLLWSATWPREVQALAEDFLTDYVQVTIGNEDLSANPNIEQNIYITNEYEKKRRLFSLLENINAKGPVKILIFAQTKRTVDHLTEELNRQGIFTLATHGDVSQSRRERVLSKFRNDKSGILIATDVAARGLDVNDIQHVINFDFPPNIDDYIHRIGRTARGTKTGMAHSFFTETNAGLARELISVMEKAGQPICKELLHFVGKRGASSKRNFGFRSRRYGENY